MLQPLYKAGLFLLDQPYIECGDIPSLLSGVQQGSVFHGDAAVADMHGLIIYGLQGLIPICPLHVDDCVLHRRN